MRSSEGFFGDVAENADVLFYLTIIIPHRRNRLPAGKISHTCADQ